MRDVGTALEKMLVIEKYRDGLRALAGTLQKLIDAGVTKRDLTIAIDEQDAFLKTFEKLGKHLEGKRWQR